MTCVMVALRRHMSQLRRSSATLWRVQAAVTQVASPSP